MFELVLFICVYVSQPQLLGTDNVPYRPPKCYVLETHDSGTYPTYYACSDAQKWWMRTPWMNRQVWRLRQLGMAFDEVDWKCENRGGI